MDKFTFSCNVVFNCTYSIMLDRRHSADKEGLFPVVIRFTVNRERWYYRIDKQTEEDFNTICSLNSKKQAHKFFGTYKKYNDIMQKIKGTLEDIGESNLTLERIKVSITGNSSEYTFVSIWKSIIDDLNHRGKTTTADIYTRAYNNMCDILNKGNRDIEPIEDFRIDKSIIQRWCDGMEKGVKVKKNGKEVVIGKISDTTKGIYLRHLRAVWNECVSKGFLRGVEYPFSNKKQKKAIKIPKGANRKDHYLSVEKMTQLYRFFVDNEYWDNASKMKRYSLGMFLFQYLGNGMNLADAGRLTYDTSYFANEGQTFKFYRQKTKDNSEDESEVIVPIIEPLRQILDILFTLNDRRTTFVNAPENGKRVFPDILQNLTDAKMISNRLNQENTNIRDRMRTLTKNILKWNVPISCTWCRHSFATNLRFQGVKESYISESMGHQHSQSITDKYFAEYPISRQMEYNNKLLNLTDTKTQVDDIIKSLSDEQKAELLKQLLNK